MPIGTRNSRSYQCEHSSGSRNCYNLTSIGKVGNTGRKMGFFFFFGGVTQEVQTVLKNEAEICPLCKSPAALVEYDNVLRLFFLPVWKWSGGNPAVKCTSCPFLMPLNKFNNLRRNRTGPVEQGDWTRTANKLRCWSCLSPLDSANFKFCPYCGASL